MYTSKKANPEKILIRCLDGEPIKLDMIGKRYKHKDRSETIRFLINAEYVAQGLPPLALSHLVSSPEISTPDLSGNLTAPSGH